MPDQVSPSSPRDMVVCNHDRLYPPEPVYIVAVGNWRSQNVVALVFQMLQYDLLAPFRR